MDERRIPVIVNMTKILCKQTNRYERDLLADRFTPDYTEVHKAFIVKAL